MRTKMNTINQAVINFVVLLLAVTVRVTLAEYEITPTPMPMLPAPNTCKILTMSMNFYPEVSATVVLRLSAATNMMVATYATITNSVVEVSTNSIEQVTVTTNEEEQVVVTTNVIEQVVVATNAVPEVIDTNIWRNVTLYEYAPVPIRMTMQESMQLSGVSVAQVGLTATNSVAQVIDALIRAGMQAKGYTVTGGTLADVPY